MNPTQETVVLLSNVKNALHKEFGDRLAGVLLFGSEATAHATNESDIDILVLLTGPVHLASDTDRMITATYPLQLSSDRALHLIPADAEDFRQGRSGFYRTVKKDGVFA